MKDFNSSNSECSSSKLDEELDLVNSEGVELDRALLEIILPSMQKNLQEIAEGFPEDKTVSYLCLKISDAMEKGVRTLCQ